MAKVASPASTRCAGVVLYPSAGGGRVRVRLRGVQRHAGLARRTPSGSQQQAVWSMRQVGARRAPSAPLCGETKVTSRPAAAYSPLALAT